MPQLDTFTFATQLYFTTFCFLVFFLGISFYLMRVFIKCEITLRLLAHYLSVGREQMFVAYSRVYANKIPCFYLFYIYNIILL